MAGWNMESWAGASGDESRDVTEQLTPNWRMKREDKHAQVVMATVPACIALTNSWLAGTAMMALKYVLPWQHAECILVCWSLGDHSTMVNELIIQTPHTNAEIQSADLKRTYSPLPCPA